MKPLTAKATNGLNIGSIVSACDNSGARIVKIVSVKRAKTRKGRQVSCKIGDWVKVSIRKGDPEMKGKVFDAVVVRQRRSFRRLTGERISFTDNAVVVLKDEKGNPKGTQVKGPIAREITERWQFISKIAQLVV